MQIMFEQLEIEEAIRGYIKEQGLSLGDNVPEITLGNTKAAGFTASVTISKDMTIGLGSGSIDVLAGKPVADLKKFPVEKAPTAKKAPAKKAAAKKAPVKEAVVAPPVEEDPVVAETSEDLFAGDGPQEEAPVTPAPADMTGDSLFQS